MRALLRRDWEAGEPMTRVWLIAALLIYWALSLNGLDALPTVREDEPWQTAPGYSLWTRGVYGSELFADFAHMGERYYLFQPTFSILLGLATRLWGLGLFQVRVVPVALGALTLCLTYVIGARIAGRAVGVFAVCLLLAWRWSVSTPVFASGVLLLDQSRVARYDTLVPVWGMASLYAFLIAQQSQRARNYFLVGALAGLAGLAHLYGSFWLAVFALLLCWRSRWRVLREPPLYLIALGAVVVWLPWLLYIASDWTDFVAQTSNYGERFRLLDLRFYLGNLRHEPQRYGLGRTTIMRAVAQPGVWLLVLGVPGALVLHWRHMRAFADLALRALLVSALFIPAALGLLLLQKIPGYLLSVAPLFALLMASAAVWLWQSHVRAVRAALQVAAVLLALDGVTGIAAQQQLAAAMQPYHTLGARLRLVVPRTGRVLALHQYWFGLVDNDFRSFTDVIFLSFAPYTEHPKTMLAALEQIAPDVFIFDPLLQAVMARGDAGEPSLRAVANDYHTFMQRHHAREVGRVDDDTYGTLVVYALSDD